MKQELDPRLYAFRPDLADSRLKGKVHATRLVDGTDLQCRSPVINLHRRPVADSPVDTQILYGEIVRVFDSTKGWAFAQALTDGYVGYIRNPDAVLVEPITTTHQVSALSTFVYPVPDLKSVPVTALSLGSRMALAGETVTRGARYAHLADGSGFVFAGHTVLIGAVADDYVAVAEMFIHTPYLWAGRSCFGLDCSALVQLAMARAGLSVLRDTDMQADSIERTLDLNAPLQRGDLVFWAGHVGIMQNASDVLHANGNTMDVASEPLQEAIDRIEGLYGRPTGIRRPDALML